MKMIAVIIAAFALVGCGKVDTGLPEMTPEEVAIARAKSSLAGINDYCIDGVTYLYSREQSTYGATLTLTVKYDKETSLPERCAGTGLIKSR